MGSARLTTRAAGSTWTAWASKLAHSHGRFPCWPAHLSEGWHQRAVSRSCSLRPAVSCATPRCCLYLRDSGGKTRADRRSASCKLDTSAVEAPSGQPADVATCTACSRGPGPHPPRPPVQAELPAALQALQCRSQHVGPHVGVEAGHQDVVVAIHQAGQNLGGRGPGKQSAAFNAAPGPAWCRQLSSFSGHRQGAAQAHPAAHTAWQPAACTLERSASGSVNTPPSLPLCRSRAGPRTSTDRLRGRE